MRPTDEAKRAYQEYNKPRSDLEKHLTETDHPPIIVQDNPDPDFDPRHISERHRDALTEIAEILDGKKVKRMTKREFLIFEVLEDLGLSTTDENARACIAHI